MPDAGLRAEFHTHLRAGFDWQAIESGLTGGGIPDTNFCSRSKEGWVEMKRTDGWAVTLEPAQVGWLQRRHRRGGRVFIAVRRLVPPGRPRTTPADELWLLLGQYAADAKQNGLRGVTPRAVLGVWPGGPARWGWAEVAAHLLA